MKFPLLLALGVGLVLVNGASATNLWEQNVATVGIDERWGFFGEFQPRWLDRLSDEQATLLRGALLYRYSPEVRLGLGAAWQPQYLPTERDEKRIFEQIEYAPPAEEWKPAFRGRLEQRFLEFTDGALWRIRGKAQLSWDPGTIGAYVWDELFFHLNEKPGHALPGFDQNRFSAGPRIRHEWLTVEAGYLLQTLRRASGTSRSDHGAVLSLAASFW